MRILLVACCTLCYCSPALVLSLQHAPMAIAAAKPDASNDAAASRRVVLVGERTKEVHRRRFTKQQSASQMANDNNIYDDTEASSSNATVVVGGDIQADTDATKGDSTKAESTTKGGRKAKANKGSKPSKEQKPSSKAGKSGSDTNVPPVSKGSANNINTIVCGQKLVFVDYLSLMIIFVLV